MMYITVSVRSIANIGLWVYYLLYVILMRCVVRKAKRLDSEISSSVKALGKVLAVHEREPYTYRRWKEVHQNQRAIFASTTIGEIVVFDYSGKKIAELRVPCKFRSFNVTEETLILRNQNNTFECPLDEVRWFAMGDTVRLPSPQEETVSASCVRGKLLLQSVSGKKRIKAFRLGTVHYVLILATLTALILWYIRTTLPMPALPPR